MDIQYQPPTKSSAGIYIFDSSLEISSRGWISVPSREAYTKMQDRILRATDCIVDHLKSEQLPEGVGGVARVEFNLYDAKVKGRWGQEIWGIKQVVGPFGFPAFKIQTDLGYSDMHFWPKGEGVSIDISGRGLAEKTITEVEGTLKDILDASRYEVIKVTAPIVESGEFSSRLNILP